MADLFTKENEVFKSFMVCSAVLFLKMFVPVLATVYHRITKQVASSEEDVKMFDPTGKKEIKINKDHPDVERARRCHQNDLENIIPFAILGLLYITTSPPSCCSTMLFKVFTGARIAHTVVYLGGVRQPARAICFLTNFGINIYMAVKVLMYYL